MMLTNVFRLEGMDEIRWYKFGYGGGAYGSRIGEDVSKGFEKGGSCLGETPPCKQPGKLPSCSTAEDLLRAHLLLQTDGHLSAWRLLGVNLQHRQPFGSEIDGLVGELRPNLVEQALPTLQQQTSKQQHMTEGNLKGLPSLCDQTSIHNGNGLFLWLFMHRASVCQDLQCPSIQGAVSRLALVDEGVWRSYESNDEVAISLFLALQNRIERALVGLSYVRFGDFFVRCKPTGGVDLPPSIPPPACNLRFSVSEAGVFVQVRVCKRRVRLLSPSDLHAALADAPESSKKSEKAASAEVFVSPYGLRGFLAGTVSRDLVEVLAKRQLLPSSDVPAGQGEVGSALFPLAKPPRGVKLRREKPTVYFEVELGHLWRRKNGVKDAQPQDAQDGNLGENNCLATPRNGHGLRRKNLLEDVGKSVDGNARGGGRFVVKDDERSAVTAGAEDLTAEQSSAAATPLPELVDPPLQGTSIGREGWQTEGIEGIGNNKSFYFENPPSSLIYPIQGVLLPVWPAAPARTYLRRCWLQGWSGRSLFENVVYLAGLGRWGQDFSRLEEVGEEREKKVPQQDEVKETKEEIAAEPKTHYEDQAIEVVEDSNSSSSSSSSSSSGSSNTSNSDATSSGGETGSESESDTNAEDDEVINGCVGAFTDEGGGAAHVQEQEIAGVHMQGEDNDRALDLDFVDEREDAGMSESIDMGVEEVLKSFEWDEEMNGVISDDQDDLLDFNKRKGDDLGDDFLLEFGLPTKLPRTEGTDAVHDNKQFSAASESRESNGPLGLDFPDQVTSPDPCGELGTLDILKMEGSGEMAPGDTLPWAVGPMPGEYNDLSFLSLFEADLGEPPDTQLNLSPKSHLPQPLPDCNTEIPGIELDGQKVLNGETEKGSIAPMTPESGISVANEGKTMLMSDPKVCEAVIVCPPSYRAVKLPQPMSEGTPGSVGVSRSDVKFQYTPSEVVKTWMDECAKRKGYIYSAALPTSRGRGRKRTPKDILGHSQVAGSTERFQRRKIGLVEQTAQITGTLQTHVAYSVVGREGAEMAKLKQEHSKKSGEHGKIHSGEAAELDVSLLEGGTYARPDDAKEISNRLTKQNSNGGFSVGKTGQWEGVSRHGIVNSTELATATDCKLSPRPPAVASEIKSMILFVRACERARVMLVQEMEKRERAACGNLGGDTDPSVPSKEVVPLSHSGKGSGSAPEDAQIAKGWAQCKSEGEISRSMQGQAVTHIKVEIGEWRDVGQPARSSAQEPLAVGSQMLLAKQVQDGLRSRGSGGASLGLGLGLSVGTAGIGLGMSGSGTGKLDGRPGITTAEVGVQGMTSNADVCSIDRNQNGASGSKASSDHKVGARGLVQGAQQQAGWTACAGRGENLFGGGSSRAGHAGVPDSAQETAVAASPAAITEPEREISCWGDMVDAIPLLAQQALVVMDAGGLDGECGDGALPQLAVRSCIAKKMSGQGATGETSGVFIGIDELGDGADDVIPEVLEPLAAEVTPSNVATLLLSDISHAFGNAFWEGVAQGPLSLADWCRGGLSSETSNTGDAVTSSSADQVGRGTPGGESITGSRGVGSTTSTMTGSTPEPVTPPQLGSTFVSSPAGSSVSSVIGGVANPASVPQGGPGRGKGVGAYSSAKAGVSLQQPQSQEQQQQQKMQDRDNQKQEQGYRWESFSCTGACPHQQRVLQKEGQSCAMGDSGQGRDAGASAFPDQQTFGQWRDSVVDRGKIEQSEGEVIMLPTPPVLVGYQEDSLKTSPGTLRLWEKAPLEPYAPPKPVIYYVLCQALEPLLVATGEFFHELSTVYETCRLGTHLPAQLASGMQKVGVACPPGVVAVPVQPLGEERDSQSVLTPPTYGSSFGAIAVMERFNKEEYRESLRKVCNCLQLSTVSATPKRDHEHDPCVVVYVVCPSTEPDVILDTTIDVCQYLAHVEWLDPMQLLSASRIGRKSQSSAAEDMARGRKDCLPLASSSGVSSARVAVQLLTVEVVMRCGTPCAGTLDTMKEVAFSVYTKARRQPRRFPAKFQGVSSLFYRNFQLQYRASQQKLMSSLGGCSMGMQHQQPAQPQGQQQVSQHRTPTSSAVKHHVTSTGHSLQGIQPSGQLISRSGPAMTGATSVWKDCGSRSGLSEERFGGVNSCEASEDQGGRDWSGDTDWKGVVPPRRLGIAAEEFSRLPAVDKTTLPAQVECKGSLRLLYEPLFILAESGTTSLGLVRSSVTAGLNREVGRGNRGLPDSSEGLLAADGPGEGAGVSGGADTPGRQGGDMTNTAIPTPNMHCCYKWTESGRWLVSVWTDVRGELLDVLVLPVEAGLVAVEDDREGSFSTNFSAGAARNSDHRSIHRKALHMDQEKRTQQLCMLFRLLLEQGLELLAMADEAGGKKPRDIVVSKIGYMLTEERDGWDSAICGLGEDEGWPLKQVITPKDCAVDVASSAGNQAGTVRVRHPKGRGSGMEVPASALDQGMGHNRTQMSVSSVAVASGSTIRSRGMSGVSWGAVDRQGYSGATSTSTVTHSSMGSGRAGSAVGTPASNSSGPVGNSPQDSQEKKGRLKWVQSISLMSFCVERSMQVVWSSEAGSGTGASIPTASQLRSSAINAGQAIASIGITPVKSLAQGAYLMVPSHSLHFLAPRAQTMSSIPGAFNEPWGQKANSAVPAASALIISSVSSSPFSNAMSKGATEEWPLNLRVSLMSHYVPAADGLLPDSPGITSRVGMRFPATATTGRSTRLWGTSSGAGLSPSLEEMQPGPQSGSVAVGVDPGRSTGGGSSTDGPGKASTRGIGRSRGEGEPGDLRAEQDSVMKMEARRLVEAIAADMYALSWLTLSPIFPSRRSVLPIHGAIAQRLARILTYMDEEYHPPKQQT